MLKTEILNPQFNIGSPCVMVLGGFDGVHTGHKKLFSEAKKSGAFVGVTTIFGGKNTKNLYTEEERKSIFSSLGVDFAVSLDFEKIRELSPQEFISVISENYDIKGYYCGEDFRFGYMATGDGDTLKQLVSVPVNIVPLVRIDGEKISMSKIKSLVSSGEVDKVKNYLGDNFFLFGEVVKDRGVGKTLGFPTANIFYPKDKYELKIGVYETCVTLNGKKYKCITNYGTRPTFEDDKLITETYIDGFSGDLYGKNIKVEFVRFLRGITKFETKEELISQLERDIREVRNK